MLKSTHPIAALVREDKRYAFDAYIFVFEALSYAQNSLGYGTEYPAPTGGAGEEDPEEAESTERHVSGRELCEAIRVFALDQFGYMAKAVLQQWGIRSTSDFGEIVFNLIRIGQMRKTEHDRREDFDDVYDFETAFEQEFKIQPPESK